MDLNICVVKKISSVVISCQSAVKLDLQKLLNLTILHLSKTIKTLQIKICSTQINYWLTSSSQIWIFFISCQSAVKFGPQNSKMRLKAHSKQCFTKHTSDQPSSTKLQILTFHGWNFSSILWKKIHQLSISCQTLPSKTAKSDTVRLLYSKQNIVQYTS